MTGNDVGLVVHGGGDTTGNHRYMVELSRALIARDDQLRYTVFYTRQRTREQIEAALDGVRDRCRFWLIQPESPWLRLTVALPAAIRRSGVKLLHTQYTIPPFTTVPTVVVIHDIFFARRPDMYPAVQRWQLSRRVPQALKAARKLIVPSEFTRVDILDYYRTGEHKMHVIPLGTSERFRPYSPSECQPVRERYGLPERFLLFVGIQIPRKNLVRLVEAFARLPRALREACPLLLGGPKGWMQSDLDAVIGPVLADGTARILGYVPDAELPKVLSMATIFAYPSLSEGFGLPAVEAMRAGTCLLAARSGSLPEVVGDAGWLVDPLDVEDIRRGLEILIQSPDLRASLEERGKVRGAAFTWERAADRMAAVFQEVLANGSTG